MKYTNFFSSVFKNASPLTFHAGQLSRIMNIVHLEARIDEADRLQKLAPESHEKLDMEKLRIRMQLTDLTGNLESHLLMKEIYSMPDYEKIFNGRVDNRPSLNEK